jgi:hypothetical protein
VLLAVLLSVCAFAGVGAQSGTPTLVNFEAIPGITALNGFGDGCCIIPAGARLSTQLQNSHGVTFSSVAGYVAVVRLGTGHATSGLNGIGGVNVGNFLKYNSPVVITFNVPGSPSTPGATDFVSIRGDTIPATGRATMEAFDAEGTLLATVTAADRSGGLTLTIATPHIHSVRVTQTLSDIAYDDLRFNPPVAVRTLERPTANAGPDQQLHVGQTVTLDGSASSDDNTDTDNLQFAWTLTSKPDGSLATLTAADSAHPSFIADLPGEYVAGLVVTDADGLASDMDTVIVSSNNTAPVADAGSASGAIVGQLVKLDGSASKDADSDPLEFSWTLAAPVGSLAALAGATDAIATFIPDEPGTYVATLTVRDPFGGVSSATATVSVITGADAAATAILHALQTLRGLRLDQVTTRGNKTAMQNFLVQALAAIEAGDLAEARSKVAAAIERTDGCALRQAADGNGPERDWIVDCEAQTVVFDLLSTALTALTR